MGEAKGPALSPDCHAGHAWLRPRTEMASVCSGQPDGVGFLPASPRRRLRQKRQARRSQVARGKSGARVLSAQAASRGRQGFVWSPRCGSQGPLPCNRRLAPPRGRAAEVTSGTQLPSLKYTLGVHELFPNTGPRAGQPDLNTSGRKGTRV